MSELDEMITQIIFMQEGKVHFHKTIADLLESTNEQKIAKAITKILKTTSRESNN